MSEYLFEQSLISSEIQNSLPINYKLRPLAKNDFEKGVIECLGQLSVIGNPSKEQFIEHFNQMKSSKGYYIIVIENEEEKIVGVGTLLVELKFLRSCGKVGHIEDIVVHDSQRGKSLGKRIIEQLKYLGNKLECYKIVLSCNEKNIPFYEKCGLTIKDAHMALYYDK
ncbi:9173_t:CDS:2 [Entrophospora sp. SA101]|nr:9173_t:CDS:2 [Entrophospora sp. SA101]CAJ0838965.1 14358_t:CDS:2 [Entrophospora sp. SA101]CAJ0880775.1 1948_t:CDS:2 [Entrophospora sp. SA101]CAJ0921787.1 13661_t:CDS:2 [Entrophospora sp. SA101]